MYTPLTYVGTHIHTQAGSQIFMHMSKQTQTHTHTPSFLDPLLVCEPSVHLFQRTNTPDSTEELLSPFHCSLNSTIESTRWRDKLEQKLNAPWGELEIENHCYCPKPFLWESENCISQLLSSNKIQYCATISPRVNRTLDFLRLETWRTKFSKKNHIVAYTVHGTL